MEGVSEWTCMISCGCFVLVLQKKDAILWGGVIGFLGKGVQMDVWGSTFIREWPTNPNPLPRFVPSLSQKKSLIKCVLLMVERVIERRVAPGVSRCTKRYNSQLKTVFKSWKIIEHLDKRLVFQVVFSPHFSRRFVWELLHLWAPNQPSPPPPASPPAPAPPPPPSPPPPSSSSSSSSSSPLQIRIQGDSWWQYFQWSLGGNFGNHRIFVSSSFAPRYDHLEQRNENLPLAVGTEDVSRDVGSGSGSGCEAWPKNHQVQVVVSNIC